MGKFQKIFEKWNGIREKMDTEVKPSDSAFSKVKKITGIMIMCVYHLRAVFLAIPVAYYALKLAAYNMKHLPEEVGINLLSSGEFAATISRELAVMGPLVVTAACIVLMFASRKALYPWAVSIFTLALPVLLLISNLYPM